MKKLSTGIVLAATLSSFTPMAPAFMGAGYGAIRTEGRLRTIPENQSMPNSQYPKASLPQRTWNFFFGQPDRIMCALVLGTTAGVVILGTGVLALSHYLSSTESNVLGSTTTPSMLATDIGSGGDDTGQNFAHERDMQKWANWAYRALNDGFATYADDEDYEASGQDYAYEASGDDL